ncbi:MAG: TetR/AcrR family transcriptional regulator [Cellulomonas sp.]
MAIKAAGLGPARRPAARRIASRAIVVDTALRLFTENGYLAVRVEDIATASGISRATFYKYFAEREEILAELFERLLGPEPERPATQAVPGRTVEEQVTGAIEDAARQMLTQERLARFVYSLPVRHSSLLRPGARTTPHVMGRVNALLEQGQERGEISSDVPLDLLTRHVHAALEAAMRDWAEGRAEDAIAHLRVLLGLAFHGMAPRARYARSAGEQGDRSE